MHMMHPLYMMGRRDEHACETCAEVDAKRRRIGIKSHVYYKLTAIRVCIDVKKEIIHRFL